MVKSRGWHLRTGEFLILLDNAASHNVDGVRKTTINELDAFVLSNITLVSFVRQPWNHGVFAAMKVAHRRKLMAASGQVDLLQCMVWVVAKWNELDAEIIQNAWRLSNPHRSCTYRRPPLQLLSIPMRLMKTTLRQNIRLWI